MSRSPNFDALQRVPFGLDRDLLHLIDTYQRAVTGETLVATDFAAGVALVLDSLRTDLLRNGIDERVDPDLLVALGFTLDSEEDGRVHEGPPLALDCQRCGCQIVTGDSYYGDDGDRRCVDCERAA